jgi:hypothetical protein
MRIKAASLDRPYVPSLLFYTPWLDLDISMQKTYDLGRMSTEVEVFLVVYTYPFQLKFGNYCRNSAKQPATLYVHSSLLKTPLRK